MLWPRRRPGRSPPAPAAAPAPVAPAASPADKKHAPPAFTLSITPQHVVTFVARDARAADIALALSKELKVPVRMSPLVAKQLITRNLNRVPLEDLLHALAPQSYIDYEIRWDRPQEDWVGIELTGFNEREPDTPVEQKAFMVFAGSTRTRPSPRSPWRRIRPRRMRRS